MAKAGSAAAKRMFTMGVTPSDESSSATKGAYFSKGKFKDVPPRKKKAKKKAKKK